MGRFRAGAVAMAAALLLSSFGACGRRDPGPGGAHVLMALPREQVEEVSSIDLLVDQPLVEIGATTAPVRRPPFRIRPAVGGRWRWIGTRTASFVPDRPLPAATRFECLVPAGTRTVNGHSIDQDYRWWFETPRPAVERSLPDNENDLRRMPPDARLFLEFNQPVEPAAVGRSASLLDSNGVRVEVEARRPVPEETEVLDSWPDAPLDRRVVIVPRKPLRFDTAWRLTLAAGLSGSEGSLKSTGPWAMNFRTRGPFRLVGVPANRARAASLTVVMSNPVDPDSLRAHLRLDPPVAVTGAWRDWEGLEVTLSGPFRAGMTVRISLTPGLKDDYGQTLEPGAEGTVTLADAEPSVSIVPESGVLERSGRREIAVLLTNVNEAELRMAELLPDEIREWVRPRDEYAAALPRIPGRATRQMLHRRTPWNVPDTLYLSTDDILGPRGGGALAVWIQVTDPKPKPRLLAGGSTFTPAPPSDRALLRVTNLGITAKISTTGHLVWVTTLDGARPVSGAELEIRDMAGTLLWRGTSDSDGLARGTGLPRREGPSPAFYVTARSGDDMTWLPLGDDWALEPWNFGIAAGDGWGEIDGFIHGDRNLYRPGETVHLRGILRRHTMAGLEAPADLPVEWQIDDPRGDELLRRTVVLDEFGTTTIDLALPPSARTGGCSVRIVPVAPLSERHWGVWGNFQVAEYRAPEFEVAVRSARPEYRNGERLDATISGRYFFGAPLGGGRVRWVLSRHPYGFTAPSFEEYSFADQEITPEYELLAGHGEGVLDPAGRMAVTAPLDLGRVPVSLEYTFEADVRDLTGRSSAAQTTLVVHRGDVYPGVKVESPLIRSGRPVTLHVVMLTPERKPATESRGTIRIIRREWRTVRRQLVGGVIGAETATVDSILLTRPLPAGAGPHDVSWMVPSAGYYRVMVDGVDRSGRTQTSATGFYAAGPGDFAWGWSPGIELQLVTDRKSYAPGDTAHVLVRSPYREARALFSVEREGIQTSWTRALTGTSELIDVPIPRRGAAPNLYFSAVLVIGSSQRTGADPRVQKPEFRLGYATLPVEYDRHRLSVRVRPDRVEAMPRDSVTVTVELQDSGGRPRAGQISLAVVDEAVLKLLGMTTPDPLEWFYRLQPIAVTTSELRRQVRQALSDARRKGEEPGGGGGFEGDSWRSFFATTAFWNGALRTDATGRAVVGFRLPDNLTTFRVMAVAVDRNEDFGAADTSILVTKPLLVQPALPRFLRAGDRFTAGAIVHNRGRAPVTIEARADADGLDPLTKGASDPATIAAGADQRLDFGFHVARPGAARVRLSAAGGGLRDGLDLSIPVEDPVIERIDGVAGIVDRSPVEEEITTPAWARADSAHVTLGLAPTIMVGAGPAFEELAHYPYDCAEQTASSLWSRLLSARLFGTESPEEVAAEAVTRLSRFQCQDGGLSLWPGQWSSSPMLTAWALLALGEARRAGADVSTLADPAIQHLAWELQSAEGDTLGRLSRGSEWAMVLWAISEHPRSREVDLAFRSSLDFLTASREKLTVMARIYLAVAWSRLPDGQAVVDRILAELANRVDLTADMAWLARSDESDGWDYWWGSDLRRTGFCLTAFAASASRSPLEPRMARWVLDQVRHRNARTTQACLAALLGLSGYRDRYESTAPDLEVAARFLGAPATPVRFQSRNDRPAERRWAAPAPGLAGTLRIDRSGSGALYYSAMLDYREPSIGRPPVESTITITRSWEPFDSDPGRRAGQPVTSFRSGDLVLVRLTVVLPEAVDFLVVADPLPAGLEPVQLGFATTSNDAARRMSTAPAARPGGATLRDDWRELRDREVRAYADHVEPGVWEYRYLARAVTPGQFGAPRARAELMYRPEVVAFSDSPPFVVTSR